MPAFRYHALRFQLSRLIRIHPVAMLILASMTVVAVVMAVFLVMQLQRLAELNVAISNARAAAQSVKPVIPEAASGSAAPIDLPEFESAPLVEVLNQTAADSGLPLEDVSYALEDGINQPYLRYRITMTLNGPYPLIRRLIEQLERRVPHMSLDSINCARKDIQSAALTCDLAFSAFFQRGKRG